MRGKGQVTIYVRLLDDGVDAWRPVEAVHLGSDTYRIVTENRHPADEQWEFSFGDVVRCQEKTFSGGTTGLVATERVNRPV